MVFPRLRKWASLNNWKIGKKVVYGEYNGYLFSAYDGNGYKAFTTTFSNLDTDARDKLLAYLEQNKKALKISEYTLEENTLIMTHSETIRSMKIEYMDNLIKNLTSFFINNEIPGKEICYECHTPGSYDNILVNDTLLLNMCSSCYNRMINRVAEYHEEPEFEDRNYIKGSIGAFLGGLIASIPWILVSYFFSLMASILGYLIGWAALKSYILFKGKIGKATPWIIGFITVFCVIIAQFIDLGLYFYKYGFDYLYLGNYIIAYTDPEIRVDIFKDLAISIFMALLGFYSIFKNLQNEIRTPEFKKVN